MSTKKDPLLERPGPDRVHYAIGALLDDADFQDEQTYHRGRLARVLAYLHGSGTVGGLNVSLRSDGEENLVVSPGLAVDRLGRLIEVSRSSCLRLGNWLEDQPTDQLLASRRPAEQGDGEVVLADLFIKFESCARGKQPAFAGTNMDNLNAVQPARLRDAYRIELMLRTEGDPKLPSDGFPDLPAEPEVSESEIEESVAEESEAERLWKRLLRYKLEESWRESTTWSGPGGDLSLDREHLVGQDGTELLLARVAVPVTLNADGRPQRDLGRAIAEPDNQLRRFVFSAAELLAWHTGIGRANA